jgi:hypothetical protein
MSKLEKIARTVRCKICGSVYFYLTDKPEACDRCKHPFDNSVSVTTEHDEEAKVATHYQVRSVCLKCWEKRIFWVKNGETADVICKACDNTDPDLIRVEKIPSIGTCNKSAFWLKVPKRLLAKAPL